MSLRSRERVSWLRRWRFRDHFGPRRKRSKIFRGLLLPRERKKTLDEHEERPMKQFFIKNRKSATTFVRHFAYYFSYSTNDIRRGNKRSSRLTIPQYATTLPAAT